MKKTWDMPAIEEIDIKDTAWTTFQGAEFDEYTYDCRDLYNS